MRKLMFSDETGRVLLFILALTALMAALHAAQSVLAPVVFGLVIGVVLSPVADRLNRYGVPRVIVASTSLALASVLLVAFFLMVEPLVSDIIARLPRIRFEIQSWIETLSGLLQGIESLSDEIERSMGGSATDDGGETNIPSVMDALWLAPNFGAQALIFAGTLFFFVLTRDEIYAASGGLCETFFRADRAVARYFAAVTVVNAGLGLGVFGLLAVLGVNNAILWGLTAAVLNFVLYLGPLIMVCALLVAGLMQFGGAYALVPPLGFLMLNLTEAQFVTPSVVGQHLQLSPLIVFLAIVVGLWLWGPVGGIVALPVLLWCRVFLHGSARKLAREEAS